MHFVFVESNTTGSGRLAIERLLSGGHYVTVCCSDRARYPFLQPLAKAPTLRVAEVDTNDPRVLECAFDELTYLRRADAILTFSSFYVIAVAELAARRGLRFLNPEAARRCHDKYESRLALQRAGLAVPEFRRVTNASEARELARTATFPLVVKPRAESGSTGVKLVHDAEGLLAHYAALTTRRLNERGQALDGHVLVEQELAGPEFSVETMTVARNDTRVVGVTAKRLSRPPYFVELGHDFPAPLSKRDEERIVAEVLRALSAVDFDLGPAHTEVRLTPNGPVIVEINPRLAGGMIPELVRYARCINLTSAWMDLLVGRAVDVRGTALEHAAIRFLVSTREGRLLGVDGLESARAIPGVKLVQVDKTPGAAVRPAASALDRLGFIIASGPDRASVDRSLARAMVALSVRVAPSEMPGAKPLDS
jgi:cysteine synthase A